MIFFFFTSCCSAAVTTQPMSRTERERASIALTQMVDHLLWYIFQIMVIRVRSKRFFLTHRKCHKLSTDRLYVKRLTRCSRNECLFMFMLNVKGFDYRSVFSAYKLLIEIFSIIFYGQRLFTAVNACILWPPFK